MSATMEFLLKVGPLLDLLIRFTLVLALCWLIHGALLRFDPRWRRLLLRSIGVGVFCLPLTYFLIPGIALRIVPAPTELTGAMTREMASHEGGLSPSTKMNDEEGSQSQPNDSSISAVLRNEGTSRPEFGLASSGLLAIGVFLCWAMGTLALALLLFRDQVRVRRMVARSRPAPEWLTRLGGEISESLGLKTTFELKITSKARSPFVSGLLRPVIILPAWTIIEAERLNLRAILAHELTHIRSRDIFWLWFFEAQRLILWFHPLVWRFRKAYDEACEQICDAVAADHVGDVDLYSKALAWVALESSPHTAAPTAIAMARSSEISARLALLSRKLYVSPLKPRHVILMTSLGLSFLITTASLRLAYTQQDDQASSESTLTNSAEPEQVPVEEGGRVFGWVLRLDDNSPVADADVFLTPGKINPGPPVQIRTDQNGYFEINGLQPTRPRLLYARKDNMMTLVSRLRAYYVRISPEHESIGPVLLTLKEAPTYTIRVVSAQTGLPISGAKIVPVEAYQREYLTDENGEYSSATTPERWTYRVSAQGFKTTNRRVNFSSVMHQDILIELEVDPEGNTGAPNEPTPPYAFAIRPAESHGVEIQGIVVDSSGVPIEGATVIPAPLHFPEAHEYTDSEGKFRVPAGLKKDGAYLLYVFATHHEPKTVSVLADPTTQDEPPSDLPLRVELGPGHFIRGRVVSPIGIPLAGAEVEPIMYGFALQPLTKYTFRDGVFELDTLTTEARFNIRRDGFVPRIGLELPLDQVDVEVVLYPAGSIMGNVVAAATGAPVEKFLVHVWQEADTDLNQSNWSPNYSTRPRTYDFDSRIGLFRIARLAAGRSYTLNIRAEGYGLARVNQVIAGPMEEIEPLEITLTEFQYLPMNGIVQDEQGRPVRDARVLYYVYDVSDREQIGSMPESSNFQVARWLLAAEGETRTDENGSFAFDEMPIGQPVDLIVLEDSIVPSRVQSLEELNEEQWRNIVVPVERSTPEESR